MKRNLITISLLSLIFILIFVAYGSKNEIESNNEIHADWVHNYLNEGELIKNADLIIRGKVEDEFTEKRKSIVVTKNIIDIKKIYKGDLDISQKIEVAQTGGEKDGIVFPSIAGVLQLEKNKEYLLFLEKTNEDHYLIMGGFQGIARIDGEKIIFEDKKQDNIAKEWNGRDIEEIENDVKIFINK